MFVANYLTPYIHIYQQEPPNHPEDEMAANTNTQRPTCGDLHTIAANSALLVCNRVKNHQGSHTDTRFPGPVWVWAAR